MTRPIGPAAGWGSELAMPFAVLSLCWVPVGGLGIVWTGGRTASWLSGHEWTGPAFGWDFARRVLGIDGLGSSRDGGRAGGVAALWPGVSELLVWSCTASLVIVIAALAALVVVVWLRTQALATAPVRSLASARDIAALAPAAAASKARRLRPSLPRVRPEPSEVGVPLGRLRTLRGVGQELRASWEDVLLAVMAPRAGKTTALAVPAVLDAPGAVVATSNKADLWATTSAARERSTGERVWVFDPQQIVHAERTWWWNPLRGVTAVEEAHRLAGHFITEVRGDRGERDFWTAAAHDLITGFLLAAGLSGRDLVEVYEWLNDPVLPTPVEVLRRSGQHAVAASLLGRMHGAPETRDGVYETARTAAQCLRDDAILTWVTPPDGTCNRVRSGPRTERLDEFDAAVFATSRQSLYLLSKDGAGAAAPLVAALTDRVMREATRAAERRGGRLDPPLVVVLDEAANVCRIGDLPDLYSHLGSRGITPITILQSYKQGVRVWGEHGMDTLWSASTIKIIGPGLDDARVAEDLSRLIGDHDVPVRSISRSDRYASQSISLRRQRILGPEDIRALPRGRALLLATGVKAALVDLQPWYQRSEATVITDELSTALTGVTQRARLDAGRPIGSDTP